MNITQLSIDLKYVDPDDIVRFYKEIVQLSEKHNLIVMDDGNAPYTEDMTEQYQLFNAN